MGALDKIVSTVLTSYKADTKDHRAELKKLAGAEKKRQKALIEGLDKQNKGIEDHIAMWSKVAVGIGAVVVAAKVLEEGFETLKRNTQLAGATIGVNLEGLRKATNGLVDDTRLLQFASKAMNGTFKLSQAEMEQSLQGVLGLRKEGIELTRALENVEKALTEGTVEPLKEFGHVIKGVENDTREGLNAALNDLRMTAEGVGNDFAQTGDKMTQAQVDMANASDDLKESMGQLYLKLTPVVSALARFVALLAEAASSIDSIPDTLQGTTSADASTQLKSAIQREKGIEDVLRRRGGKNDLIIADKKLARIKLLEQELAGRTQRKRDAHANRSGFASQEAWDKMAAGFERSLEERERKEGKKGKRSRGKGKGSGKPQGASAKDIADLQAAQLATYQHELAASMVSLGSEDLTGTLAQIGQIGEGTDSLFEKLAENLSEIEQQRVLNRNRSILVDMFGVPSEIDAQAEAMSRLAQTFDGFAGAFGSGVDAMITGSESFASAFKRGIAETLRSLAVEMSIQALKHGAFALGSLAFQDYKGAANHGAAAGMFAAGAVAAGTGAKLLGAGASTGASGGGAGRGAGAGPAGVGASSRNDNKPAESTRIIVLDNGFKDLSARERRSRVRQISRDAGIDVQGDVVMNG